MLEDLNRRHEVRDMLCSRTPIHWGHVCGRRFVAGCWSVGRCWITSLHPALSNDETVALVKLHARGNTRRSLGKEDYRTLINLAYLHFLCSECGQLLTLLFGKPGPGCLEKFRGRIASQPHKNGTDPSTQLVLGWISKRFSKNLNNLCQILGFANEWVIPLKRLGSRKWGENDGPLNEGA